MNPYPSIVGILYFSFLVKKLLRYKNEVIHVKATTSFKRSTPKTIFREIEVGTSPWKELGCLAMNAVT